MAAYISVPRDLTKVKSKVAFNLTARQLVCFGAAAVVGVPLFFVLRDTAGNTGATLGMMAVMLPMFFLAMYQKNGQPAEKILMYYIQSRFIRPKVRPYADLYDIASFESKKMIVSQLIRRVDVYRGYQIHVDFNFDLAQYLENSDELAC